MTQDAKKKINQYIGLALLTGCFVAFQIGIFILNRNNITIYNGVFLAFQYGICLLMLCIDRRKGLIVSIVLMTISELLIAEDVFLLGRMSALPGFCNGILYIITLVSFALFYKKRERESITDMLTGTLNRRGLYKTVKEQIDKGKPFSIIYVSLDNYKAINDTHGHAYGDALIRKITKRMTRKIGKDGVITRINGAEFAVIVNHSRDVEGLANDLLDVIKEKAILIVDGNRVDCFLTCFAGVSSYPYDANDYESLIKYADIAMFKAMSDKSEKAYVFNKYMAEKMNRQVEVENLIKEGLVNGYFYLVYQPQYRTKKKILRGFETLIRMKDSQEKSISPAEFIPIAEKSDLIIQIDDYVLNRAMESFKDVVTKNPELTLSVNVSARDICDPMFTDKLKGITSKIGFPPTNLEIEITEYSMVDSMDISVENIKRLRAMGIKVALDDFGTGYTSLSYVSTLPINLLKVDKSLIDDIETSPKQREFVHAVVAMGQIMGCEVISEGVETEVQLQCLRDNGCDFVQGFVWGKPMSYDDAVALIDKKKDGSMGEDSEYYNEREAYNE